MEKMDVDEDAVVDLSVKKERDPDLAKETSDLPQDLSRPLHSVHDMEEMGRGGESNFLRQDIIAHTVKEFSDMYPRRNLRPRIERSYAESPDVVLLSDEEPRVNGFTNGFDSDSDEGEMPPLPPIKELSKEELAEREQLIKKLKEELRNEEMKLVLLKKLRQSQQMKENIAVVTTTQPPPSTKVPPTGKLPPPPQQQAPPPLVRANQNKQPSPNIIPPLLKGQPPPARAQNLHAPPPLLMAPQQGRGTNTGIPNILMAQQSLLRGAPGFLSGRPPVTTPPNVVMGYNMGSQERMDRTPKESHHSPSTPTMPPQQLLGNVENKSTVSTPMPQIQEQERPRVEENQTPAQRQAAAKLALRKQLEKTLLQIPPPKPPPPEMHFIPNPSNTEFIYLLGLEHVVDYITKDVKTPPPPDAFQCSQCDTDFTPVWKWEKNPAKGGMLVVTETNALSKYTLLHVRAKVSWDSLWYKDVPGKEPKVICEQCVTTNVKKALKAEHTNRLKTAFVKALQQEQEIEQRMAQVSNSVSPQPEPIPKSATPTATIHHAPTPPAPVIPPPTPTPVPPPPPTPPTPREHPLAAAAAAAAQLPKLSESKFSAHPAGALQAAHQQLLRLPQHQPLPAHMLPFSPLFYPYQLAMAQAAGGKGPVAAAAANLVELQRQAADLQRQYLLDMIPSRSLPQGSMNWKT